MDSSEPNTSVLIIGTGMAGLTAAAELQRAGRRVRVLDKGRGVGGRLASRRMGEATFDHGAQFITTRAPRFVSALEGWRQTGVVEEWCRGSAEHADGHPRWRGNPSMNSVAKHLARGLEVHLEKQVVALRCLQNRWRAETDTGEVYSASAVVLTPPVPQSLVLMAASGFSLQPEMHARLAEIDYDRCLAVMAVLEGAVAPATTRRARTRGRPDRMDCGQSHKGHFGNASRHDRSDDVFALDSLPAALIIVGGGYIAVEMAALFSRLGSKVTIVYRGERLLRNMEPELGDAAQKGLRSLGAEVMFKSAVARADGNEAVVRTGNAEIRVSFDRLLVAAGRTPHFESLGLEKTKVRLDAAGLIEVDATMKTADDSI